GQPVTITATSTVDVQDTGRWLEIYDLTAGSRLTYCAQGTSCSTTVRASTGGVHEIVGYVNGQPEAVSDPIYVTWLAVSLSATSVGPQSGGTVYLKAAVNADLAGTPYVVGIYDQQGRLVDHVCKSGASCSVQAWMSSGATPTYTAIVGQLPAVHPTTPAGKAAQAATASQSLVNIQAESAPMQPTHVLYGVDSCKAIVGDPTGDLFSKIVGGFGTPEFWGRYLTDTVCPGISSAEVSLAAHYHIGILPIYNDYDCSNVSYYDTGHGYAAAAVAAAQRLGIPKGRALAIDIEPAGADCPGAANVDSGFIEGWYDGIRQAGYVPMYYGNGTAGSEFATAWCSTVSALPQIASGSALWSFEPSLLGAYSKPSAPSYAPYDTGCAGNIEAWQFQLGGTINADVDQDEALSSLALWYPSA
ncbi:MAG TPA: glycoside hydrolase domain-containing protein, partial [Candidatus Udaeobacter sp.]|nr:glycoside hydrolase domain-containing protein [Candidatus Udaeobacter sp.]